MCMFEILIIRKYLDIKKIDFRNCIVHIVPTQHVSRWYSSKANNISNGELETLAALSIHLERTLIDSVYQLFFRI